MKTCQIKMVLGLLADDQWKLTEKFQSWKKIVNRYFLGVFE